MKKSFRVLSVSIVIGCSVIFWSGCGESQQSSMRSTSATDHGHDHGPGADHDQKHDSEAHAKSNSGAPHAGTPVQVGDHGFHLELVHDPIDGKMLAYVLDGHMERAVEVPVTSFELIARAGGEEHRLMFTAATNAPNASAEKTSVFSAPAAALAKVNAFEGVIPTITLDGKTFEAVTFSYPKGTRHAH